MIELPPAPTFVLDAYHARLGRNLSAVALADAVEFMVAAVGDLLTELNPDAGALFDDLAEQFNTGHGELVEAGLALALGDRIGAYDKVRSALGDWLDNALVSEVVPALRQAAGPAGDDYITDVAAPSLEALSVFLLEKLDAVVSGVPSDAEGAFLDKLSAGCSTMLYRLVARNAIYLDAVVNDYVHDSLEQAFADLEAEVRSDPDHVLVRTLALLLPTLHPGNPAMADANAEAVRELVATMASIGRDAFGPRVWGLRRRERLRDLKGQILLGVDERADWSDRRAAEAFLSELILCEYVPAETALTELAEELGLTIGDLANVIVPRALSAWGTFLLAITRSVVEDIDRAARELLAAVAAAVDAALAELERWRRAVADAIEAAKEAARALTAGLREVERILESNSRRSQIRDQLRGMGAAEADRAARNLGGDDNAAAIAVGAFNIAFNLILPVLDLAFDAAEEVAGDLADVIAGALDAEEAFEEIVEATVDAVIDAINDALSDFGLSLPTELSASDIADAIAESLPTGTLLIAPRQPARRLAGERPQARRSGRGGAPEGGGRRRPPARERGAGGARANRAGRDRDRLPRPATARADQHVRARSGGAGARSSHRRLGGVLPRRRLAARTPGGERSGDHLRRFGLGPGDPGLRVHPPVDLSEPQPAPGPQRARGLGDRRQGGDRPRHVRVPARPGRSLAARDDQRRSGALDVRRHRRRPREGGPGDGRVPLERPPRAGDRELASAGPARAPRLPDRRRLARARGRDRAQYRRRPGVGRPPEPSTGDGERRFGTTAPATRSASSTTTASSGRRW